MTRRSVPLLTTMACALLATSTAWADGGVLIVPLGGELAGELAAAPEYLTATLVNAAKRAEVDAVLAEVSRAELSAVAGCSEESPACLLQVAETLGASAILVGEVRAGEGDASVQLSLTLAGTEGDPIQHSIALRGKTLEALSQEVEPIVVALLTGQPIPEPEPEPEPEPTPDPFVEPTPAPQPRTAAGFDLGRVKAYTWGIAGGGAALAAGGAVFLGLAKSKQSDVDGAVIDTVDDFDALVALENDGKRYNRFGNGMLVVGGAAVIVGTVLIIKQARSSDRETQPTLTPVPVEGGATVIVTWSLP